MRRDDHACAIFDSQLIIRYTFFKVRRRQKIRALVPMNQRISKMSEPIKVLLIEDDPDFKHLMEIGFRQVSPAEEALKLQCADDIANGIRCLSNGKIDVILLDLNLKESKGLETLRQVHAQAETVPIVVLTGKYDESIATQALKEGAEDYLVKGKMDRDAIVRSIRYAIERMKQEVKIRELLRSIPSILIGIGPDDRVTHWNQVAEDTFGVSQPGVIHKPLSQSGIPWDYGRLAAAISECRTKNDSVRLDDISFKRPDGKEGFLGISVNPIKDSPGKPQAILLFGADITEKRQLEAHLRQASKLESLGTLAAAIAHEFNNMLTSLLSCIALMKRELAQGTRAYQYLEKAKAMASRAVEFATQVLTFGRGGDEKKEPIDLAAVVRDALQLIQELMPPVIETVSNLCSESATITANPNQIHQVLMNLATNASYAMRKSGGTLMISLEKVRVGEALLRLNPDLHPGSYLKLTVRDTGEGIPSEVIGRIFEPFFTTKPESEGTGMGLAVVYGIVKSHGGAITVSSQPGCGTTFDMYFPQ